MTAVLGVSAFYHDSAAALVVDGRIVAAAQEERFTRQKHDERYPRNAIEYCLSAGHIAEGDLDYVVFYEKPLVKFERLLETYCAYAPAGYRSFRKAIPQWLLGKVNVRRRILTELGPDFHGRVVFTTHHEAHAASAFFPSPFEDAAILTVDGVGEWATTCLGKARGNRLELTREIRFPHSLGLLYSAFTYYTGFRVNSGEHKVMGLAPYGRPLYKDAILENLIDLKSDGSFRLDMQYFNYCQGLTMTSARFHKLFGVPPRTPETGLKQRDMDLAASVQAVVEEVLLRTARHLHESTGCSNLAMAGGVALNCVAGGRILRETPFDHIWIQPAPGDAGGALGAALFAWHQLLEEPRTKGAPDHQAGSFLGPCFSDDEIDEVLRREGVVYTTYASEDDVCEEVASLVDQEKVVGWFQGRMEFGPRALGARSILGDARSRRMQSVMNLKIKFRESFRPFAPAVLREHVDRYFQMRPFEDSPYMLLVAPVRDEIREPASEGKANSLGLDTLYVTRSSIPAVTHVDYSARVQTVDAERNPLLARLLTRFHEKTGCPVMINTSFNVRGEPIVCTPNDALRCFLMTDMDALAMGRHLLLKEEQKDRPGAMSRETHLAQFQLD